MTLVRPSATGLLLGSLTMACMGSIDEETSLRPAGRDPGAVANGSPSAPGANGGAREESAGPWNLQRLTTREYDNTIRELLGLPDYGGIVLPNDAAGDSGFIRAGDVTSLHVQAFFDEGERLARTALQLPSARVLSCSPVSAADEEPCALTFIGSFGKRAFRRPLAQDEIDDLVALYRQARGEVGYGFRDAIGLLVQRFLQSASFLYHRERGPEQLARDGALVRLGPYEVASRLSYTLWGTMPDTLLLAAADAGGLQTPADVSAEAERLLGDRRALANLASFHQQWLGVRDLGLLQKDSKLYPDFASSVKPSLEAELSAFIGYVFRGDARLTTLLTAPVAFATPATAKLYGLSANAIAALKPGLTKIDLDPNRRAGLLTQLAFLAANAKPAGSNPVTRGLAVWKQVLCGQAPPPPPKVPDPPSPAPNLSTRDRFAQHELNPCATCHKVFDPPGFAFEHYDAIGAYRTVDGGKPVDSSGILTLPATGQVVAFPDAVGLMQRLATSDEARRCLVRQWFRYAVGRAETEADLPSIDAAYRQAAGTDSLDLKRLVLAIVQSRPFLWRAPSPGEM